MQNLLAPDKPAHKTYNELCAALEARLSPKPLIIAERYRFHKRDQRSRETIAQYIADLRRLARHCEYGNHLEDALRDRLMCGIHDNAICKRLPALRRQLRPQEGRANRNSDGNCGARRLRADACIKRTRYGRGRSSIVKPEAFSSGHNKAARQSCKTPPPTPVTDVKRPDTHITDASTDTLFAADAGRQGTFCKRADHPQRKEQPWVGAQPRNQLAQALDQ